MAVSKTLYSKTDHINTYWIVGAFRLCLSKREMVVKVAGYKNKAAREAMKDYGDFRELTLPVDPMDRDLVDYEELIINYSNYDKMEISIELTMKVNLKAAVSPNITRIVDKLINYGYYGISQNEEFKGAQKA